MFRKHILVLIFVLLAFSGGWVVSEAFNQPNADLGVSGPERPIQALFSPPEQASPYNWVEEDQIEVYKDRVVLNLDNPVWAKFTNTNSMDPVIDEFSHAIQIVPKFDSQIHIGDIISYKHPQVEGILIHRVISLGNDGEWYAIVKGDNNSTADPGKVRFNQISRVLVAVIY